MNSRSPYYSRFILYYLLIALFAVNINAGIFDSEEEKRKAQQKVEEEVDVLTLAALMIKDGHFDRAKEMLSSVDTTKENFDHGRHQMLIGLVGLQTGKYEDARNAFEKAVQHGKGEPLLFIYLAQVYNILQEYERTLWALEQTGPMLFQFPDLLGVKAQCQWALKKFPLAIATLEDAQKRYKKRSSFSMRIISYMIELGLYQEAMARSDLFLQSYSENPESYLVVGEAMRRAKQYDKAVLVLEKGTMKYQDNDKLLLSLAHSYLQAKKYLTAARLFEKASLKDQKFLKESIGLYRLASQYWKAEYLNAQVNDTKKKLGQWIEILLAQEKFEEVAVLVGRIEKVGLLEEDKTRYAVSYALFRTGEYDECERLLKGIRSAKIFKQGVSLLKAIEIIKKKST
ncbi:MAG: tetratricopeptide repeat protein [Planctomycetes bacterium]|nr:tetratricopeptide repeat protein [Planctomycetota bacterium]